MSTYLISEATTTATATAIKAEQLASLVAWWMELVHWCAPEWPDMTNQRCKQQR